MKVGDKVVLLERWKDAYAKVQVGKEYEIEAMNHGRLVFKGVDWEHGYKAERFQLVVPAIIAEAKAEVIRLRVIEAYRPARLRLGDIVTVEKEHATTYLLKEHPGKLFKKARFERIVEAPAPDKAADKPVAPRKLKIGDKFIVAKEIPHEHEPHVGWVAQFEEDFRLKTVLTVRHFSNKDQRKPTDYYAYPLPYLTFADGSLIDGGYVPPVVKKAPRPVDKDVKIGDKVIPLRLAGGWANEYHKRMGIKEDVIGQVLEVISRAEVHQEGDYVFVKHENNVGRRTAFPIKDLVYADGGVEGALHASAITKEKAKPVPPPKKVLPDIFKELEKAPTHDLCQYIYLKKGAEAYVKDFRAPCYASLGRTNGPVERLVIGMKKPYDDLPERSHEAYNRWLEYVVEQSPFRSSFITKTAEEAKKGLEMDCNKSVDEIMCSAIAMRDGYEHCSRLIPFVHFLDEGYSGNTAFLLSFMLNFNNGNWSLGSMSDGHSNMSGCMPMDQVIKFYNEGYHRPELKDKKAFNVVGGSAGYWVSDCIARVYKGAGGDKETMKDFVIRVSGVKYTGEGWGAAYKFTDENIKQLADELEKLIGAK